MYRLAEDFVDGLTWQAKQGRSTEVRVSDPDSRMASLAAVGGLGSGWVTKPRFFYPTPIATGAQRVLHCICRCMR